MSTPAMAQDLPLRDIHVPPPPDFWPPAPGWWMLLGLGLALLGLGVRWLYRRYLVARRRRRILVELEGLAGRDSGPELVAAVSALLKRVALAGFPQTEVASLTGQDWLAFLDRNGGGGRFAGGPGGILAEGPYAPSTDFDQDALLSLARDWIRRNL